MNGFKSTRVCLKCRSSGRQSALVSLKTGLTLTWGLVLLSVSEQPAAAFYDPQAGRWLNRDPISERGGANVYAAVKNDPVRRVDALGRFSTADHEALTESSFMDSINGLSIPVSEGCMSRMLGILDKANQQQDLLHLGDQKRHFNRDYINPEGDEERVTNRQLWWGHFQGYLVAEASTFNNELVGWFWIPQCKSALKTLGRMSHSWQDFYGHAIHETSGFAGNGGAFTASPDAPGAYWPSSYSIWPWDVSEHPPFNLGEPTFPPAEYAARRAAARQYVKGQFDNYLNAWLSRCLCKCYDL